MNNELLVKNALIVTCDEDHSTKPNSALVVSGKNIQWIGDFNDLPAQYRHLSDNTDTLIDAGGNILMPGLINMHAHCGDSLFRGLVENLPLEPWLQTIWKAQAVILKPKENCRLGAELGIAELLLGGTTTIMDNYWRADQTLAAAKASGVHLATGGIFFDPIGMDGDEADVRAKHAQDLFDQYGNDDDLFIGTMPHGAYTVGPDNLKTAIEIARNNNGFFSIHAAETKVEQQTIADRYQTSVIRHLDNLDALWEKTVLAHCVHLDEVELDLLAQNNVTVAHNPLSNLKLASGFAPVTKMLNRGINVTLGTDGPISGNDLDMWLAMRLAATKHKAIEENPSAISTRQVLHMATLNGAKALGAQDRTGSIEVGKKADFILVDTSAPHASPMFDPINHLVFSASKNDVTHVFASGRQLVRNRELLTLDWHDIRTKVQNLQPQILAALEA